MRPTKHPQSALRAPLNHILGTEANVRVLRVLFRSPIPMGMAELARSTALQASGLPKVCDRLEDLGVIETVGRGHNRQFWRRLRSPLANHLSSLFSAEHDAGEAVLSDIRSAVLGMSGVIRAAWIEGSVAKGTDLPGDPIVVVELVDASSIESTRDGTWANLLNVQERHDVTIELKLMTEADLRTVSPSQLAELELARPILGAPPSELARPLSPDKSADPQFRNKRHEDVDAGLLRLAQRIADRLKRDPALIQRAKEYIERRMLTATGSERLALREWSTLIESTSVPRLRRLLVQDTAQWCRLRQSMPFVNILEPNERLDALRGSSE